MNRDEATKLVLQFKIAVVEAKHKLATEANVLLVIKLQEQLINELTIENVDHSKDTI